VIDTSQLSPEKRAFLKVNPELLKSLEQQAAGAQKRKEKMRKGKAKWQRDLEDADRTVREARAKADKLRREYDPLLREIQEKLLRKLDVAKGEDSLVCPKCGEGNVHGNKMNGKPWCFKCNIVLVPKSQVAKWLKLPKMKVLRGRFKDDVDRLVSGEDE
jgi:formylmethanofuran dehydrogenase subunit E